jgi:hypothetical protein
VSYLFADFAVNTLISSGGNSTFFCMTCVGVIYIMLRSELKKNMPLITECIQLTLTQLVCR